MAWQIAQAAEREAWGAAWVNSGHVFTNERGEQLRLQYVTRLFDKLRRRADLPPMTFSTASATSRRPCRSRPAPRWRSCPSAYATPASW
jgi:hypothetical protein